MNKVSSIELLRFISALMVLVWHYQQFYLPYNFFSEVELFYNDKSNQPFYEYLSLLYLHGNKGVEFFFIISGYVFAYVYLIEKKITLGKEFFLFYFYSYILKNFLIIF
jgi:peptidoglycan/LPS O-acetylase OafA/YrhL